MAQKTSAGLYPVLIACACPTFLGLSPLKGLVFRTFSINVLIPSIFVSVDIVLLAVVSWR